MLFDEITFFSNFSTFCNFIWQPPLVYHVSLSRRSFRQINKKELITILLLLQSKVESANNEILDQVRQSNQKFSQLAVENSAVKQANSLWSKRLVDMERQCWANAQYSRRALLAKRHLQDVLKMFYQDKQDILPRHLADVQKMS